MKELHNVRNALIKASIEVIEADLQYVANEVMEITDETTVKKIIKMMDAVEEIDDVTDTYSNFDIDETILDS